jgi:hypothetical protein
VSLKLAHRRASAFLGGVPQTPSQASSSASLETVTGVDMSVNKLSTMATAARGTRVQEGSYEVDIKDGIATETSSFNYLSAPVKLKGKRSTGEDYEVEIINIVLMLPRSMQSSLVTQMAIPFVSLCSNSLSLDKYMTLGISKLLFARIKGFSSTVTADW